MNNKKYRVPLSLILILILLPLSGYGQSQLIKGSQYALKIPNIIAMQSTPTHFYVLSETEGLVVFRNHADSLEWLYSSPGMQKRGNTMTADIRFAYLFGNGKRLTVIEPTSLLGVYSSTTLPAPALDARRINNSLYLALGSLGLGKISLNTPDEVDGSLNLIKPGPLQASQASVINLESTNDRLLALTNDRNIYEYKANGDSLTFDRTVTVQPDINHIFLMGNNLLGSTASGDVYTIDKNGTTNHLFSVGEPVSEIIRKGTHYIIRTKNGHIWIYSGHSPVEYRKDASSGNFMTMEQGQLWMNEFSTINRMFFVTQQESDTATSENVSGSTFKIKAIGNKIIPYPHPLLLALETQGPYPVSKIQFHCATEVRNVHLQGNGLYWQPTSNDIGLHKFTITGVTPDGQADSTSFTVEVRTFNEPPRFSPIRPMSIGVNDPFSLQFHAIDPDGENKNLVRYLGKDLPEGATLDEKTGLFKWTPNLRQVGKNTFELIATDQYGAASSLTVNITVVNVQQ